MTLTLDSSAAFELLAATDTAERQWLRKFVAGHDFVAPSVFRYELSNLVRREFARGRLSGEAATAMLRAGLAMPLTEYQFDAVLQRAWELRGSFTFVDASYIAVAEASQTPLVTLDESITRGPAVRCEIILAPPSD